MNNNLLRAFLPVVLLAVSGSALALGDILDDGGTVALSNPRVAEDSDGRLHIVAQSRNPADIGSGTTSELVYMMVTKGGTVRIAPTVINTVDTTQEGRAKILVLPDDRVVIVWAKSGEAVRYVLIDPSLDDQNGNAATPGVILVRTETAIGTDTGRGHMDAAVDSAGIVHVAKTTSGTGLRYNSFNPVTNVVVTADTQIDTGTEDRTNPAIGVDSDDNVHIAYCSNSVGAGNCPAAYMMLNGADGAVLIDTTQLFNDVEAKAAHFSLAVDGSDRVHIAYGDKRNNVDADDWCVECSQGGTAIYTVLNPAADDQSGDAATLATIQRSEVELGNLWYFRGIMSGGAMRIIGANGKGGALTYVGSPGKYRTVDTNIGGIGWSRHYVDSAGGQVVWAEAVSAPTPSGGTWQLRMASLGSFAGGGGGGSPGLPFLLILGLAGLLRRARA